MNIQQVYETTGLTRRELARKLDVSENYLWMIESGKRKMSKAITLQLNQLATPVINNCQQTVDNPPAQPPTQPPELGVCPSCGRTPAYYQPREVIEYGERLSSIQELLTILRQECNSAMIRHEVREAFREERCGLATFYLNELNTVVVPLQCVMTILEEDSDANKYVKALIKQTIAHIGRAAERLAAESGKCKPKGVRHDMS